MHGAYICYYNKEGKLHEEKYVGAGLSRRIWNEDVEVCRFVPPEKASYFYVQAVAGGGAGGSSGYTNEVAKAARTVFESQPEAIPPFGVSANWLELKGIDDGDFTRYGGTLWAYGRGDGDYGDAGGGGDIYFIERLVDDCQAKESWHYPEESKQCEFSERETISYDYWSCSREYEDDCTCSDYWSYYPSCGSGSTCSSWTNSCSGGTYDDPCPTTGGECRSEGTYDDPDTEEIEEKPYCKTSVYGTCKQGTTPCMRTATCYEYEDMPIAATCSEHSQTFYASDYKTWFMPQNQSNNPVQALLTAVGTMKGKHPNDPVKQDNNSSWTDEERDANGKKLNSLNTKIKDGVKVEDFDTINTSCQNDDVGIREIRVPQAYSLTICNYGITEQASSISPGITGSCFYGSGTGYDDCSVTCDGDTLQSAYGKLIGAYGTGQTSINYSEVVPAADPYFPLAFSDINGIRYEGCIAYDLSEENGGVLAYGDVCKTSEPGCTKGWATEPGDTPNEDDQIKVKDDEDTFEYGTWQGGGSYTPPGSSNIINNKKSYIDDCRNVEQLDYDSWSGCSSSYSWDCDYTQKSKTVYTKAECVQNDQHGAEMGGCMYSSSSNPDNPYRYTYIVASAKGGAPGLGHNCAFSASAQKDLLYQGYATIIPGIKGSDRNLNGAYKGIYYTSATNSNWATWAAQAGTHYAEDGTDSSGMVYVSMGQSCTINQTPPKAGKGAYVENHVGRDGEDGVDGSFSGAGEGQFANLPAGYDAGGHVGYCLVHAPAAGGNVDPFGKYTFKYTWTTSHLNRGEGGEPGEYRSMVIRSFKDRDMIVVPGLGGVTGDCAGGDGGDTYIFTVPKGTDVDAADVATWDDDTEIDLTADGTNDLEVLLKVKGGAGGPGCIALENEQLPYMFENIPSKSVGGGDGKRPTLSAKANIMGLVLPLDDSDLGKWLSYAGSSGHGGGSTNTCWTSSYERWFETVKMCGVMGCWDEADVDGPNGCNGQHGSPTPAAANGIPGAVVIKW